MKKDVRRIIVSALLYVLFLIITFVYFSLASCSPKIIEKTEIVTEYKDRVVHDTATVEIVKEVEKIVTLDTVSHLENRYAMSDASVSGGFLSHSLESIPQYIKVPVEVHVTDTVRIEKEQEHSIVKVEVEKELSWWQRLKINAFWVLIAVSAFALRKPLASLWNIVSPVIKKLFKIV